MELVFKTYSNTSIIHKGVYVYFEYIQNVFQIYTQHIKAILQVHPKLIISTKTIIRLLYLLQSLDYYCCYYY
jgi:hypothetical protein